MVSRNRLKSVLTGLALYTMVAGMVGYFQLAKQCAEKKIRFNVIGVGTEWNQSLIKDLAKLAEGDWGYIDVNDVTAAERVFARSSPPWPPPASSTSKCTCASRRT